MATWRSSMRPARRYRARRRAAAQPNVGAVGRRERLRGASSMPLVTKWNVVPPSIATGGRGWCVSTNTSQW